MGDSTLKKKHALILSIQKNDQSVLKQLYQTVYPKAKFYVLKNNGNEEQAKDVFQEAFIACWKNVKENKVDFDSNLEAYLFTITKNKWMDYLRSAAYKKTVNINGIIEISSYHEEEKVENGQDTEINLMRNALEQLGEPCRKLLLLYYFERLSMKQIAIQFGIDNASAKNKKYRCMQALRTIALKIKNNGSE